MTKKNGFTLVELLVSIAILGILAAIATVVYSGVTVKARDSQRMRDLQTIAQALELYRSDVHNYPLTAALDLSSVTELTNCTGISGCTIINTYLSPVSVDVDPNRTYYYFSVTNGSSFILCARKEGSEAYTDTPAGCLSLTCGSSLNCNMGISSR